MTKHEAPGDQWQCVAYVLILTLILVALKLLDVIFWPWIWVLCPIWIGLGLGLLICGAVMILWVLLNKPG